MLVLPNISIFEVYFGALMEFIAVLEVFLVLYIIYKFIFT